MSEAPMPPIVDKTGQSPSEVGRRFVVALSFAGEFREKVEPIAADLAGALGKLQLAWRNGAPRRDEGRVGDRLRRDYSNGRSYYALQDKKLIVPTSEHLRPSSEALAWHRENIFLG